MQLFFNLFVQLIKTRFFKLFLSDVQHPEHAGMSCKYNNKSLESHDFAMLILKASQILSDLVLLLFAIERPETPTVTECKSESVS